MKGLLSILIFASSFLYGNESGLVLGEALSGLSGRISRALLERMSRGLVVVGDGVSLSHCDYRDPGGESGCLVIAYGAGETGAKAAVDEVKQLLSAKALSWECSRMLSSIPFRGNRASHYDPVMGLGFLVDGKELSKALDTVIEVRSYRDGKLVFGDLRGSVLRSLFDESGSYSRYSGRNWRLLLGAISSQVGRELMGYLTEYLLSGEQVSSMRGVSVCCDDLRSLLSSGHDSEVVRGLLAVGEYCLAISSKGVGGDVGELFAGLSSYCLSLDASYFVVLVASSLKVGRYGDAEDLLCRRMEEELRKASGDGGPSHELHKLLSFLERLDLDRRRLPESIQAIVRGYYSSGRYAVLAYSGGEEKELVGLVSELERLGGNLSEDVLMSLRVISWKRGRKEDLKVFERLVKE
ncbi:MAG: hypothetical protein GX561_03145 [Lentisphaerae bacterium]|jgi:hypothetical protein|nr:hypothetical protein [Lentisphaerota bacterium]